MNESHIEYCPTCELGTAVLPATALYCRRCGTRLADPSRSLNPQQREAVEVEEGPVAVIAGAGSGKTRIIEYRVLNLVQKGIAPESILLLTFTQRAAREMTFRAARHDPRCKLIVGGTFHSFANRSIREYAEALGISPGFRILDAIDTSDAISRCKLKIAAGAGSARLPEPRTLQSIFSKAATTERSLEQVVEEDYPFFGEVVSVISAIHCGYRRFKQETACLDFDDLTLMLRELVRNKAIRARMASRHRYIIIDEYQDTNVVEADAACLLGSVHGNLMIVGDDAQSIYGFRGADYRNILAFPRRFPGCRIIKLEQNYRSTQPILDLANAVLESMKYKYSKCLRSACGEHGDKPILAKADSEYSEAQWVADQIRRNLTAGVDLHRQAVLYRSTFLSDTLQLVLQERGIAFRVVGGPRTLEAPHVKLFLAHLQLLVDHRDILAWSRVLSAAGLGHLKSEGLTEALVQCDNLASACDHLLSAQPPTEQVAALVRLLRQAASASPAAAGRCAMVAEFLNPMLRRQYDDWPERTENINSLCRLAARHQDLPGMLRDLVIDATQPLADSGAADQKDMLTLSTIHSAKGLEWDIVYLLGMSDGVFPDRRSIDSPDRLEEERRLLYVAITRARRKLMLSTRSSEPSRFLRGWQAGDKLTAIGVESLEKYTPAPRQVQPAPQALAQQFEITKEPATGSGGRKGCLLGWLLGLVGPG